MSRRKHDYHVEPGVRAEAPEASETWSPWAYKFWSSGERIKRRSRRGRLKTKRAFQDQDQQDGHQEAAQTPSWVLAKCPSPALPRFNDAIREFCATYPPGATQRSRYITCKNIMWRQKRDSHARRCAALRSELEEAKGHGHGARAQEIRHIVSIISYCVMLCYIILCYSIIVRQR